MEQADVIRVIKEGMALRIKETQDAALADYGIVVDTGSELVLKPNGNQACHAGIDLTWGHIWSLNAKRHGKSRFGPGEDYRDFGIRFITWLIGETSPWFEVANHLEVKDPEWIWDNGYILNPGHKNLPGNLVYGFFIATRVPTEHANRLRSWINMTDAGISPALALFGISIGTLDRGFSGWLMGHYPLTPHNRQVSYYKNLVLGNRVNPSPQGQRTSVDNLWGDSCGESYYDYNPESSFQSEWMKLYPDLMGIDRISRKYSPKSVPDLIQILQKEQERLEIA